MPHHKSTAKRVRTNEKRRVRNAVARSRIRTAVKKVRSVTDPEQAMAALREAFSELDRGAKRGIIKKGTADRTKARLTRHLQKIAA